VPPISWSAVPIEFSLLSSFLGIINANFTFLANIRANLDKD